MLDPLELLSGLQRENVDLLSRMYNSLSDWNDKTGPTRLVMTCFYADHGENAVIVPQNRYWPPPDDWHSADEMLEWANEHASASAITFLAGGKFGISVKDALQGNMKVTFRVVDDKVQISPYFALHILYPGCAPCCMPTSGQAAFSEDGKIDATKLVQAIAERIHVLVQDGPQVFSPEEYNMWNLANVGLEDIILLQLKYVSPRDGWQPVLGLKLRREKLLPPQRSLASYLA